MEMQAAALLGSLLNESLDDDFLTEILARLPVEFVYNYRLVCKQWNDFLSSNYFLTKWNSKQPRLLLCSSYPRRPCIAFCFYTWTWIKPCFTFSFIDEWISQTSSDGGRIHCKHSMGGLIFVAHDTYRSRCCGRLCNPYTRTFVQIPTPHFISSLRYTECIVVDENNIQFVAVGNLEWEDANGRNERKIVEIYEPSQKRWNIAGYFPDGLIVETGKSDLEPQLLSCDGLLYSLCQKELKPWELEPWEITGDKRKGMVCFKIPIDGDCERAEDQTCFTVLDENGSTVALKPIPTLFVPFPEKVQYSVSWDDLYVEPRMITCGSRLLLIAALKEAPELEEMSDEEEVVIILWEFKNEGHPVLPSNSPSWEWVEIARMPSLILKEWRLHESSYGWDLLIDWCIGVGDHVCFVPEIGYWPRSSYKTVAYNLIDNTWNWLPSFPGTAYYGQIYNKALAFEPTPHGKVE